MQKVVVALVVGLVVALAGVALADDGNQTSSLVDQRQPTHAQELAAKNPGPKHGPIVPPNPIVIKPVDRTDPMSVLPAPGMTIGALVPATSGGSASDEKAGLERELRHLATRLK